MVEPCDDIFLAAAKLKRWSGYIHGARIFSFLHAAAEQLRQTALRRLLQYFLMVARAAV
jgi:hypothetical protein